MFCISVHLISITVPAKQLLEVRHKNGHYVNTFNSTFFSAFQQSEKISDSKTNMATQNQKISSVVNSKSFLGEVGPTESSLLFAVLPITLLIVFIPVAFFLLGKPYFFVGVLGLSEVLANVYSAAAAVLLLHFLLGLFIYRAVKYGEKKPDKLD